MKKTVSAPRLVDHYESVGTNFRGVTCVNVERTCFSAGFLSTKFSIATIQVAPKPSDLHLELKIENFFTIQWTELITGFILD